MSISGCACTHSCTCPCTALFRRTLRGILLSPLATRHTHARYYRSPSQVTTRMEMDMDMDMEPPQSVSLRACRSSASKSPAEVLASGCRPPLASAISSQQRNRPFLCQDCSRVQAPDVLVRLPWSAPAPAWPPLWYSSETSESSSESHGRVPREFSMSLLEPCPRACSRNGSGTLIFGEIRPSRP